MDRRQFLKLSAATGAALFVPWKGSLLRANRALAYPPMTGDLPGGSIPKYQMPLVKPPAMPKSGNPRRHKAQDKYAIAMRQFQQQILPTGLPQTTVWSYGSVDYPGTVSEGGTFNYPAFTIEAEWSKPARVKWMNELVDANGNFLPHILPVDQTLHWANPPGGLAGRDMRGLDPTAYMGPVPMVTHVHGAHTFEQFDGYPEAWYLPNATNIPAGYATTGTMYDQFVATYGLAWGPGLSTFTYPNDQRATTLWYHDHTLGMTRLNVYAGPAGFYLIRGGLDDQVTGVLPGPAPVVGSNPFGTFYEIPIVIQDRSFNADGSLFYPDVRAFFEGLNVPPTVPYLDVPFIPDPAVNGMSDVSPIWQPEFFGDAMVVNGSAWPYLDVEQRRYRLRLLNGCNSRFLILDFGEIPGLEVWQIGAEGGFLPAPVNMTALNGGKLLMAPAERADVIVDFTNVPAGEWVLGNLAPDAPFGGYPADPDDYTMPQMREVMQFRVGPIVGSDPSTPPNQLGLPTFTPLGPPDSTRQVSLNEEESKTVFVTEDADGNIVFDPASTTPFGPTSALLGTLNPDGTGNPLLWMDPTTENPLAGTTEVWEIHNFTMDAHPIHVHLVQFQVVDRVDGLGNVRGPEAWETGYKDTVIAYPGEITRIKARFDVPGLYVWHCHIVEHEDNEMMRPYRVV